jgi:hypothetical protein
MTCLSKCRHLFGEVSHSQQNLKLIGQDMMREAIDLEENGGQVAVDEPGHERDDEKRTLR